VLIFPIWLSMVMDERPANISYRVGRRLEWDGENRWFVDDVRANLLTTRNYRKPYVVPDRV